MSKKNLFATSKKSYGKNYDQHLYEEYKLYVEGIEKVSDRRQSANNYFLTINTVIISFTQIAGSLEVAGFNHNLKRWIFVLGVTICAIWWYLIRAYKQLNAGKFNVIHQIENKLPLRLYSFEWDILKQGKDRNVYYPFSHIELLVPWVFALIYLAILFSSLSILISPSINQEAISLITIIFK